MEIDKSRSTRDRPSVSSSKVHARLSAWELRPDEHCITKRLVSDRVQDEILKRLECCARTVEMWLLTVRIRGDVRARWFDGARTHCKYTGGKNVIISIVSVCVMCSSSNAIAYVWYYKTRFKYHVFYRVFIRRVRHKHIAHSDFSLVFRSSTLV